MTPISPGERGWSLIFDFLKVRVATVRFSKVQRLEIVMRTTAMIDMNSSRRGAEMSSTNSKMSRGVIPSDEDPLAGVAT